jgi:succinyl-CoA synthetase beta subunit
MNIHEYQAKELLRKFGVVTGKGTAAFTVDEAVKAAEAQPGPVWVVKAQIHAGGRGLGGGVKVVKSIADVKAESTRILGMTLVTPQTGPEGKLVQRLYIEEGTAIARELYLSMLVDRETSNVAFIASTEGGMSIEDVAHNTPEKIITIHVDPAAGYQPYIGRRIANALKLEGDLAKQCGKMMGQLYKAFIETDMSLLEINPLVVSKDNQLIGCQSEFRFQFTDAPS